MEVKQSNERIYYDALKTISKFMTPEQLRARSVRLYGLDYEEALEMSYDNIRETAKSAIGRRKRPRK